MYIVIEQVLGKQILKIQSATAHTVVAETLSSKYKSLIEVAKKDVLFSSCNFKDCFDFVWKTVVPKTKYDWSKVPEDVESIATDSDGSVKGFESASPAKGVTSDGKGGFTSNYSYYDLSKKVKPYQGNWQDSLELRPKN